MQTEEEDAMFPLAAEVRARYSWGTEYPFGSLTTHRQQAENPVGVVYGPCGKGYFDLGKEGWKFAGPRPSPSHWLLLALEPSVVPGPAAATDSEAPGPPRGQCDPVSPTQPGGSTRTVERLSPAEGPITAFIRHVNKGALVVREQLKEQIASESVSNISSR
eukprot:766593-Hanusia_phi.AAC.3